ncbi:B-cell linker protein [Varanus komodoensis]|nr:B-cell linker protein [Varanus komodoensis]
MVFPVAIYGCESWTIRKAERQRIEAFELWCWRRLLRVPWTARRSNRSVLEEINPDCSLEGQILKMKLKYIGHLMKRKNSLEKSIMLGTIDGKRRRVRQRMRWLDGVTEAVGVSLGGLQGMVEDRKAWRNVVHGVTMGRTGPQLTTKADILDHLGQTEVRASMKAVHPSFRGHLYKQKLRLLVNTAVHMEQRSSWGSEQICSDKSRQLQKIVHDIKKNDSGIMNKFKKLTNKPPPSVPPVDYVAEHPVEEDQWTDEFVSILITHPTLHLYGVVAFLLQIIYTCLHLLAGLGVGGTALRWFRSYPNGRFQKVVLGDYGSAPRQLCHGVPQGFILSPLLFNIYMKPLGEVIRRCALWNHQYADDTQLYLSFSTNPGEAVAVLNRCLAEVMGWMRTNKLKLNPDKMEVLLVGGSGFGVGDLDLVLYGVALPLRDKVRSLGVLLDPELSLEAWVARSAFLQLRLIHQLRPYLENDCLATVTHALDSDYENPDDHSDSEVYVVPTEENCDDSYEPPPSEHEEKKIPPPVFPCLGGDYADNKRPSQQNSWPSAKPPPPLPSQSSSTPTRIATLQPLSAALKPKLPPKPTDEEADYVVPVDDDDEEDNYIKPTEENIPVPLKPPAVNRSIKPTSKLDPSSSSVLPPVPEPPSSLGMKNLQYHDNIVET